MAIRLPSAESMGQRPVPQPGSSVASYRVDDSSELPGRAIMAAGGALLREGEQIFGIQKVEVARQKAELEKEQNRVDTMRAEDAFTKLRERQLDLTVGPKDGFVNIKGGEAINQPLFENYSKRFVGETDMIASTLGNDRQRELFMQRARVAGLQFGEDVLRHTVREGDVYAKQVFDGTISTEIRNATAHWDEPNAVALSVERVNAAVRTMAERNGWAPEIAEAKRLEENGKIHSSIVQQALATGNYKYAQDWYEKNKADIDKPTAVAVQKAVEDGTQKQLYAGYSADFLANRSSPAGLDALEQRITADPTLDPLRANALLGRVISRRETLANQARVVEERRLRIIERQINTVQTMTLQGFEPTPAQMAPILNAAKGTELEGTARQLVQTANATRQFRLADPRSQEQYLTQIEAQARKDPTKFDVTVINRFRTIYDNQRRAVKEDPTTFAVRQGLVEPNAPAAQPLDFSKAATLGPQLQARFDLGRSMQSRYGAPFKPLTEQEQEQLGSTLKNAGAAQKREIFAALATATAGDRDGYKAIMSQLAPDDPVTSIAGILANKDSAIAKGSAVADMILQGQQILHPSRKADGTPSAGAKLLPPDKDLANSFRSYERDAFAGYPAARSAYYQTAQAIYAAKAAQAGDYSQVLDSARWEDSIKLATGGIDKYNGKAIVLPWGQDYGQFRDGLNIRMEDALASGRLAEGMTMSKLRDMPLEMAGESRYVFRAGDALLVDKNNQPVLLDFNREPQFRRAVDGPTDAEMREAAKPFTGRAMPRKAAPVAFSPDGKGYDYDTAKAAGMGPTGTGENAGHWGSVAEASAADRKKYGLPDESYIMLKGKTHETWDKAVKGEQDRGFKVVKLGNRYYSVPSDWKAAK